MNAQLANGSLELKDQTLLRTETLGQQPFVQIESDAEHCPISLSLLDPRLGAEDAEAPEHDDRSRSRSPRTAEFLLRPCDTQPRRSVFLCPLPLQSTQAPSRESMRKQIKLPSGTGLPSADFVGIELAQCSPFGRWCDKLRSVPATLKAANAR